MCGSPPFTSQHNVLQPKQMMTNVACTLGVIYPRVPYIDITLNTMEYHQGKIYGLFFNWTMPLYESQVDSERLLRRRCGVESVTRRRCDVKSSRDMPWLSANVTHTQCLLMRTPTAFSGLIGA